MARHIIDEGRYSFNTLQNTVTVNGHITLERLLIIVDVTTNDTIYNFASSGKGGTVTYDSASHVTTILLEYDVSANGAADGDSLQIYIDEPTTKFEPKESYSDPVDRLRTSNPQALIDTDFEYSLQPTKWETLQTQHNIPSVYQKSNEPAFTADQITSIISETVTSNPTVASTTYLTGLESNFYNQEFVPTGQANDATMTYTIAFANNGSEIVCVGSATGVDGDNTIVLPGGLQQNDLVVYVSACDFNGPNAAPTGYTEIDNQNDDPDVVVAYRFMPATPDAQITGIDNNGNGNTHIAFVLRNVSTTAPVNQFAYQFNGNNTYANHAPITTTVNGCAIIAIAGIDDDNFSLSITPPPNFDLLVASDEGGGQGNNVQGATAAAAIWTQTVAGTVSPGDWGYLDTGLITGNITLPFSISVLGTTTSNISFNSHGVLFFNTGDINVTTTDITQATYVGSPHMKLFAQDMSIAKVSSLTTGTAPNRQRIIKWEGTDATGVNTDLSHSAYVIFTENSAEIQLHYYKNRASGTVHLSDGADVRLTWTPTVNATALGLNEGYVTQEAFLLNLDTVTRDLVKVTLNAAPTSPFIVGNPITLKETLDPVYLDRSNIIVQVSPSGDAFYLPNLSPNSYTSNQAGDFTIIYTGGFYFTAEIPYTTIESIAGSKQVRVTFSSPPSLYLGTTIFVVDPTITDTDWIGAFTINKVLSTTEYEFLALKNSDYTVTANLAGAGTKIYTANQGAAQHRYYDGGIQISPETYAPNAKIVRQTRDYFRYQSGKGIQFSTGVLFKPTYDIASIDVNLSGYDPFLGVGSTLLLTIETEQYHGFANPDEYREGVVISTKGFSVTSGFNPYNLSTSVVNVTEPKKFQIEIFVPFGSEVTDFDPGGLAQVVVTGWNDATVRTGMFDDQNGLFFEYDGNDLYCVRRNATQQLAGLISINANSATLTGVNTKFLTQLAENDYIVLKGSTYLVSDIQSNTSLTLAPDYKGPSITNQKTVRVTDLRTPSADFAFDRLDGTGPSGYVFDSNKMQMVFIDYSWYGAGRVRYGMRDANGRVFYFHEYVNNNVNTEAYMRSGNLPGRFEITTLSKNGSIQAPLGVNDTTLTILTSDANQLPSKGRIIVKNEYMEYTKTGTSGDNTILTLDSRNIAQLTAGNTAAPQYAGWVTYNQNCAPVLSHWGVSVIIDGQFNEDKSYLFTALTSTKEVAAGAELPILTIRAAPSVDYGIPSYFGVRNLINRSQLILKSLGIITDGQMVVTVKINGNSGLYGTNSNWLPVGNGSLGQYVDHSLDATNAEVTDGDLVAQFLTDEGNNRLAASYYDIQDIRALGNSILGGPNTFPDGPDTLVVFAKNSGAIASKVGVSLSWIESQG